LLEFSPTRKLIWRIATVAVGLVAAIVAIALLHERILETRLLEADPDRVLENPALIPVAARIAAPAFRARCAGCHGADFRGDPGAGVPDLKTGDFLYGSGQVSELERTIAYGIRSNNPKSWKLADMPAYARATPYSRNPSIAPLGPARIDEIVEFLLARAGRQADLQAAARGRELYGNEGACFDCHADDASGDSAIGAPSLIGTHWLYGDGSRSALFNSIAQGHHGICPGWGRDPDPLAIRALAVYIHVISRPASP
jgi:cytochrome c oxidase cbb3-type subunit 3